jgi:protein-S-isoprenylcysteine O-methyltransferase Ste14
LAFDWYFLLQVVGAGIGIWAVRSIGENNWSVYPIPNENSSISAKGVYKIVRHPMYTALVLFFLPVALRANGWFSWIVYGILVLTLVVKIIFEERQMADKHPDYLDFKKATKKRLIPFVW